MKLYQLFDKDFNDEKFCFNAKDYNEAKLKACKWSEYHGYMVCNYDINEVKGSIYQNNIHNEWV
jgi:hypothetical protein